MRNNMRKFNGKKYVIIASFYTKKAARDWAKNIKGKAGVMNYPVTSFRILPGKLGLDSRPCFNVWATTEE